MQGEYELVLEGTHLPDGVSAFEAELTYTAPQTL